MTGTENVKIGEIVSYVIYIASSLHYTYVVVGHPSTPNIILVSSRARDVIVNLSQADEDVVHTYKVVLT